MEFGPFGGAPMVWSNDGSSTPKGRGEKIQVFNTRDTSDPSKKHFNTTDAPWGENWLATNSSKKAAPASPNWVAKDQNASGPMSWLCTASIHDWFQLEWNKSSPALKRTTTTQINMVRSRRGISVINNKAVPQAIPAGGTT
jgi:hypothetical protein